jgi:protein disulfide-isomerase A4
MVAFIVKNDKPLVGHRTKKNVRRFSDRPLVVVYYTVDFSLAHIEGTQHWRDKVLKVASELSKSSYKYWAVSDEDEFADELQAAGLGESGMEVTHNSLHTN